MTLEQTIAAIDLPAVRVLVEGKAYASLTKEWAYKRAKTHPNEAPWVATAGGLAVPVVTVEATPSDAMLNVVEVNVLMERIGEQLPTAEPRHSCCGCCDDY